MIRSPAPGEPRPEPIFSTKALDKIGANTSVFCTSGSGRLSLMVTSFAPVLTNESTFARYAPICELTFGSMCRVSENTTSSAVIVVPSQNFTPGRIWNTYLRPAGSYVQLEASSGARPSESVAWSRPSRPQRWTYIACPSKAVAMSRPMMVPVPMPQVMLGMLAAECLTAPDDDPAEGDPDPDDPQAARKPGRVSAAAPSPSRIAWRRSRYGDRNDGTSGSVMFGQSPQVCTAAVRGSAEQRRSRLSGRLL